MKNIQLDISKIFPFIEKEKIFKNEEEITQNIQAIENKTSKGSEFLGWNNLPSSINREEIKDIENASDKLRKLAKNIIVMGIGGSYLGAKSVIDALAPYFSDNDSKTNIIYAGHNISEDYLSELLSYIENKSFALVIISKSGTTTEPAIAFRLLRNKLEEKYGKSESKDRIIAITDAKKGALRTLADKEGYKTFIIPDNIGGRYSVLTPVGLLPIALAGYDINKLIAGALEIEKNTNSKVSFENNIAAIYASARYELYKSGKKIEILANFEPKLNYFAEWWKQLYGESEGKDGKGIFPANVNFTTDLHSLGQYIQEGERSLFETILSIEKPNKTLKIPSDEVNLDKLNYLSDKRINEVNKMAETGTRLAHIDGGVPNIKIDIPQISEFYIGQLIYFFEKACAISGYLIDVNPFNQPGVEEYKRNMFALLKKPGFEKESEEILKKL
ncbi:MAG: glucose-6-phosphate isomerase [Bacteroidales bacterium]|nr:glucose-6-phosphate isomerase [Bacteroidales bacterium]